MIGGHLVTYPSIEAVVFYICQTKKVLISSFDFFLHSKPFISDTIKQGGKIK